MELTVEGKASGLGCGDCYVRVLDRTRLGRNDNIICIGCADRERVSFVSGVVEMNCHGITFVHGDLARRVDVVRAQV